MEEPMDVFSDQFQFNIGPYGCVLNFMVTDPMPPAPGSAPPTRRLASIRMSIEHLKVMAFLLHRQISMSERQTGVTTEIPMQVLNSIQIGREDWDSFWKTA